MIQSTSFSFDVITKSFNAIFASIGSQRIINISISKLAVNTPTRWRVLINPILDGVRAHPILDGGAKKPNVLTLPFSV